mgnify:CR=1 FL=1
MKDLIFKGAAVAMVTPFKDNNEIDYEELNRLIDFNIENGTNAIVITGTTGESSTLSDEEHKKAWLIKTTINCSKTLLTSAWFRKTTSLEDNIVEELKEKSEVYYATLKLSKKYRTVIHLFYYEDYSVREIADILKLSESNVKTRLSRGRSLLKTALKEEWENDE